MVAAGGGDAFFSGVLLGIVTGILAAPVFRSWLVWRSRSRVSERAGEATDSRQRSRARAAANGHATPRHSPGRHIA